jgi:3-methyladenine DNA glycosylase AlkD
VTTKSWWDTVDTLASHTVVGLVARHPELGSTMDDWVRRELWVARTSILHQLRYKPARRRAAVPFLQVQAGHRDFFIRKAIGWALREYAKDRSAGGTGVRPGQ